MTQHFKIFATMADYEAYIAGDHATPLVAYISATGKCVLPDGSGGGGNQLLRSIDIDDFTGPTFKTCASYVKEVTIPSGVTNLSSGAFSGCTLLTSIDLPSGLTSISSDTFRMCTSLTSVTIPSGVTSIQGSAFRGCTSLTSITIPSGVTSIGTYVFQNCTSLLSFTCLATTPPTMSNANALQGTNSNLVIYVPAESVDAYKAASGWSSYADRIQAISE